MIDDNMLRCTNFCSETNYCSDSTMVDYLRCLCVPLIISSLLPTRPTVKLYISAMHEQFPFWDRAKLSVYINFCEVSPSNCKFHELLGTHINLTKLTLTMKFRCSKHLPLLGHPHHITHEIPPKHYSL